MRSVEGASHLYNSQMFCGRDEAVRGRRLRGGGMAAPIRLMPRFINPQILPLMSPCLLCGKKLRKRPIEVRLRLRHLRIGW